MASANSIVSRGVNPGSPCSARYHAAVSREIVLGLSGVAAGDVVQGFAPVAAANRLAALVRGELEGVGPCCCPRALARSRPSPVRARINSRSNSASPPSTVSIKRPCAVVVSAHASCEGSIPGFLAGDAPGGVLSRSRVERAKPVEPRHHHHVTGADLAQQAGKLRPVGLHSARHLPEHLLGSGDAKLAHLCGLPLPASRYPA